jgi:glyoxylase-like metal-dependent hydrolase (beta-lactamase superfamily II)
VRVHHLNCATLCPYNARLLAGKGGWTEPARMVAHVLAIETSDGLALVDTGLGTGDIANPARTGGVFRHLIRPQFRPEETALAQLERLDFSPADVRHVFCTHLDVDHAGGLPDFPAAEVHLFRAEMEAALAPSLREKPRYIPAHFQHSPRFAPFDRGGEEWFGFEAVRVVPGLEPEIAMIPLVGHTRGHSAVALRDPADPAGERWLLHCGDAYFNHREIETPPRTPPGLAVFEGLTSYDDGARKRNQGRLRELAAGHGDRVRLFCSHDHEELEALTGAQPTAAGSA